MLAFFFQTKMVRRHMPDSEATARGHLDKTTTKQPHPLSQAVSARRRAHLKATHRGKSEVKGTIPPPLAPFDPTKVPRSTTLHLDYTGRLPRRGSNGTLYFLISCWGSYIHIEPLKNLQGNDTADAIERTVKFFRDQNVVLNKLRMDNQSSPEVRSMATRLNVEWDLVNPYQKEPNRAERAIRTAKNHILAVRAGFHRDCPETFIDKCLFQMELTLNLLHPFEYDPKISAHHGLFGRRFDFGRHPIAPAGTKVLTWNSPDNRGSWSDHGVLGIYLGPAMKHFRGFHIWVPQTSSARISGTVWWFLKPLTPSDELLSLGDLNIMYPASKERRFPMANGSDLLGRVFVEPTAGMCCITRLGPIPMDDNNKMEETLHYRTIDTQAEFYATVSQITAWIEAGPLLVRPTPAPTQLPSAPVTYPCYFPRHQQGNPEPPLVPTPPQEGNMTQQSDPTRNLDLPIGPSLPPMPLPDETPQPRRSQRKRKARDFLTPTFKGKVYVIHKGPLTRKQRVPVEWVYLGKERVSQREAKMRRLLNMRDKSNYTPAYRDAFCRFRQQQRERRNKRVGRWELANPNWSAEHDKYEAAVAALGTPSIDDLRPLIQFDSRSGSPMTQFDARSAFMEFPSSKTSESVAHTISNADIFTQPMPKPQLPAVFPNGPLNLNADGTTISYRKSHMGPNDNAQEFDGGTFAQICTEKSIQQQPAPAYDHNKNPTEKYMDIYTHLHDSLPSLYLGARTDPLLGSRPHARSRHPEPHCIGWENNPL